MILNKDGNTVPLFQGCPIALTLTKKVSEQTAFNFFLWNYIYLFTKNTLRSSTKYSKII